MMHIDFWHENDKLYSGEVVWQSDMIFITRLYKYFIQGLPDLTVG